MLEQLTFMVIRASLHYVIAVKERIVYEFEFANCGFRRLRI